MNQVKENPLCEERILMEIVVDAHDESERAMGWYCYLEDTLSFPFEAKCVTRRQTSPLQLDQHVTVTGMADSDECLHGMFVLVKWNDDELAVPLVQITPLKTTPETRRAVADWHYWIARGYQF